jgi:hypothetical protein
MPRKNQNIQWQLHLRNQFVKKTELKWIVGAGFDKCQYSTRRFIH